jgi:hypothetical protein
MADTKEAENILTSSNAAEFYAERLGLAEQDETEAVNPEPEEVEEQSKPEAKEEANDTEVDKPKDKLNKRFEKVSRRAEEAEARSRELENRIKEYEARNAPEQAQVSLEGKPDVSQFNDIQEFEKALIDWSTENALKQRDIQEAQSKLQAEQEKIGKSWAKKLEQAKTEIKDFDDVVQSANTVVSDEIRDSILESEVGPQILYHLASNEDFAQSLTEMPLRKALIELGKLEVRFERKEEPKATVTRSKAPSPISPLTGGKAGADVLVDTDGQFHGTFAQYKAARQAGRLR